MGSTPDKMALARPSSPENGHSTTATLLDEPISPVKEFSPIKALSIKTFPYTDGSASTVVSPTEWFSVSVVAFRVTFID
jgi:hypothetical protein